MPGESAELIKLLQRHVSFSPMGETYLRRIVSESTVETVASGSTVFEQGEQGSFAYLVLEGEMAVEVDTENGRTTVAVIPPGNLVGEIGAFAATPRTATVSALTSARLLRLEQSVVKSIVADHPEVAMSVISELGKRIQSINGSLAMLTQAASALAKGEFNSQMLENLKNQADRFSHFTHVFEQMAEEIAEKRLRSQEMQTAAEIQRSFLPGNIDAGAFSEYFEVFASMVPAKDIGGDFYDYFMIDKQRLGFAIGDVSGKGVPAAMLMSVSRTILRTIAREGMQAGRVLERVNTLLAEDNSEGMFVTLFYGCLELNTGQMEYCSAGHDEVYLLKADGGRVHLGYQGPAVGLFDGVTYPTQTCQLHRGDTVCLFTDGITEAFDGNGQMFGDDRLQRLFDRYDFASAKEMVTTLTGAVDDFTGAAAQADDITCLAVIYCPETAT